MKQCKQCNLTLPLSEFYIRSIGIPYTLCKQCYNENKKQRDRRRQDSKNTINATCVVCKQTKPAADFHKNRSTWNGLVAYCKECAYVRNVGIKYKIFNIEELMAASNGKCEICSEEFRSRPHIDHDHSCCDTDYTCGNCFRGLICGNCNYGLGHFRDSPDFLRSAADYLERPR